MIEDNKNIKCEFCLGQKKIRPKNIFGQKNVYAQISFRPHTKIGSKIFFCQGHQMPSPPEFGWIQNLYPPPHIWGSVVPPKNHAKNSKIV